MTAAELLQNRTHPLLRQISAVTPSLVAGEFEVAQIHGMIADVTYSIPDNQNWFALPRATRAVAVVALRIKRLTEVLSQWEANERAKAEQRSRK